MSCSLCRMAFVPGPQATSPMAQHFPPKGVLSPSLYKYFTAATGLGRPEVHTIKASFDYVSGNMFCGFNGLMVLCVVWEMDGSTATMMHTGCAKLLLHRFQADNDTYERLVRLSEITGVLGRPTAKPDAGRLRHVRYEEVGEKINLQPYWVQGFTEGGSFLNWKVLSESKKYSFLINRPDVFPRFYFEVAASRTAGLDRDDTDRQDRLTNLPLDVIQYLLHFLPVKAYVNLMSTCLMLRLHSLTTFQPHARLLVLSLPWALAIPSETEVMDADLAKQFPNATTTSQQADWFRYLCHIHVTKGMRLRRWIWALCDEVYRVYLEQKDCSPAMKPGTKSYIMAHDGLDSAFEMLQLTKPGKPKVPDDKVKDLINKMTPFRENFAT